MKKQIFYLLILFTVLSCTKQNNYDEGIFFTVIEIKCNNASMKINDEGYSSNFELNNLGNQLDSSLFYYYKLKPKISNQILVKYNKNINSDTLKLIKSTMLDFHKSYSNKYDISKKVLKKDYNKTNVEEREIIDKFYPKVIYKVLN